MTADVSVRAILTTAHRPLLLCRYLLRHLLRRLNDSISSIISSATNRRIITNAITNRKIIPIINTVNPSIPSIPLKSCLANTFRVAPNCSNMSSDRSEISYCIPLQQMDIPVLTAPTIGAIVPAGRAAWLLLGLLVLPYLALS